MTNIQKNFTLLKSEIKGAGGGEAVVAIMLSAMIICANIMLVTVVEYIGALIYYANPNTQNAIKVMSREIPPDFSNVKSCEEIDLCFEVFEYNENFGTLYAVSAEFFNDDLSYLSKSNIKNVTNRYDEVVPLLVSNAVGLNVGDRGELSSGDEYEVVGVISDENVKYMLCSLTYSDSFAVTIDKGQFASQMPATNPILFAKLNGITDVFEFQERYDNNQFLISDFDPYDVISTQFSDSITISVIGIIVFIVSSFAVIINCHLVFCSKKRYYQTILTVGGKKKIFLINSIVIKIFQFLISTAVSTLILFILNTLIGSGFITFESGFISAVFGAFVMVVTGFMLNGWLKAINAI